MTKEAESELLPCHFCYSEKVRLIRKNGKHGTACKSNWYREYIMCQKCGCKSGVYKRPNKAIKVWNTRKDTQSHPIDDVELKIENIVNWASWVCADYDCDYTEQERQLASDIMYSFSDAEKHIVKADQANLTPDVGNAEVQEAIENAKAFMSYAHDDDVDCHDIGRDFVVGDFGDFITTLITHIESAVSDKPYNIKGETSL